MLNKLLSRFRDVSLFKVAAKIPVLRNNPYPIISHTTVEKIVIDNCAEKM